MAFVLHENVDYAIEKETVSLIRELIGLSDHYFGTFFTGATMANFVSLALARQWSANVLGVKASDDGLYGLTFSPLAVIHLFNSQLNIHSVKPFRTY